MICRFTQRSSVLGYSSPHDMSVLRSSVLEYISPHDMSVLDSSVLQYSSPHDMSVLHSSVLQYISPHDVRAAQMRGSDIATPICKLYPKRGWYGQQHLPAALPPGKDQVPLVQEVVWASLDDTKNLPSRRFDFRAVPQ
jgi:hypothetical protein